MAGGDLLRRPWSTSMDQTFQPVAMSLQRVPTRRLCGRKMQKSLHDCIRTIQHDLRMGLSSSSSSGGSELTRTANNKEKSSVGTCVRAVSYVAQESCDGAPRQGRPRGKELPTVSACENGDIKSRLHSNPGSRNSQSPTIVHRGSNGEKNTVSTARTIELKRQPSQVSRGGTSIPTASTLSEAIAFLKNSQKQGIIIDSYTFVDVLKRCSKQRDLSAARQVQACIVQCGMDKHPHVGTALLDVYIRCGRLQDARRVFDRLEKKTVVTWSIMIGGYAKKNHPEDALEVFNLMRDEGAQLDGYAGLSILKACAIPSALKLGQEVHEGMRNGGLESDVRVGTALMQMYAKCGSITDSERAFAKLTTRDVMAWNVMIGLYAERGYGKEAYRLFLQMEREGFKWDAITYISILNASASAGALEWVRDVHHHALKAGLEPDLRVGNVLIHMYGKSGSLDDARLVFDRLERRDLITWNVMIGAYAESGFGAEAYQLFLRMKREAFVPDSVTYVSILNASASEGALEWVRDVHSSASKLGLDLDMRVGTALVHMYVKSGSIEDARLIFERLKTRDIITWNMMIGAYAEKGCGVEAYNLFLQLIREGFKPDAVTFVSILNASASAGALEWVREVHKHAVKAGLESDLRVANDLVHMYAKCGSIAEARQIFDRMEKKDVVTWNIMIGGLAQHGCGQEALELFKNMTASCVQPDGTSFVAVLSACCHAGLLDDGRRLFSAMTQDYGIEPTVTHYTCMVDLLGRAGFLEEAKTFIDGMPVDPNAVTWLALLGACRTHGNVEMGELAAEEILKLEAKNSSAYVLLSNIYAAAGEWEKVSEVRAMMHERGVRKEPGRSWIEVDSKIHEFVVGDKSHPEAKAIYEKLGKLIEELKAEGYIPDTQVVLHDIDVEDKEVALCSHSERLAIAYGLMRTPRGKPIRVYKNLRVCSDCHSATKFISKVTGREIVVRDAIRFHHIKDGVCSCGDYW